MRYPGFIGGFNRSRVVNAAQDRTVNLYPEVVKGTKNNVVLRSTPGERIYSAAAGTTVGRAFVKHAGRTFGVIGTAFFELASGGARTVHGAVAMDDRPATISYNGEAGGQLLITSGRQAYGFTLATNTFAAVAVPAYADAACSVGGYFLVLDLSTGTMYQSERYSLTIDGTVYAQRSLAPDRWLHLVAHDREVWLLGEATSEVWFNDDGFPLAFATVPSARIERGIGAPWSAVSIGGSLIWLSADEQGHGQVVRGQGGGAEVISSMALTAALGDVSRLDDAVGWGYQMDGHTFYVLSVPSAKTTWVYDLEMGEWHERAEWVPAAAEYQVWRPCFHVDAFGEHLTLDLYGGDVLALEANTYTHASGRAIRRVRRAAHVTDEDRVLTFGRFALHMDCGKGTATGQGADPQVELLVSDDGGQTWWSAGTRSAGPQGEFQRMPEWLRLGASQNRVFEIVMTDPVPWNIVDAYLDVRAGR